MLVLSLQYNYFCDDFVVLCSGPDEIGRNKTGWVIHSHPNIKATSDSSGDGDKKYYK